MKTFDRRTQDRPHPDRSRLLRAARSDRGDGGGNALTWLLLFPVVLLILWLGVQVGMSHYGQSMAAAAAQAGVRAATSAPGDPSRAEPEVHRFLQEQDAASDVQGAQVHVDTDGATVTVTVTGLSMSVVPGLQWSVSGSASGQLERLGGGG